MDLRCTLKKSLSRQIPILDVASVSDVVSLPDSSPPPALHTFSRQLLTSRSHNIKQSMSGSVATVSTLDVAACSHLAHGLDLLETVYLAIRPLDAYSYCERPLMTSLHMQPYIGLVKVPSDAHTDFRTVTSELWTGSRVSSGVAT